MSICVHKCTQIYTFLANILVTYEQIFCLFVYTSVHKFWKFE